MTLELIKKLAKQQDHLLDQLRVSVAAVFSHQGLMHSDLAVDEFCELATTHKVKILDLHRCNKDINHPAKDVVATLALLEKQLARLSVELNSSPSDAGGALVDLLIRDSCDQTIIPSQLATFRRSIQQALRHDSGIDDDAFIEIAKNSFENIFWDFLKLSEKYDISFSLSKEFSQLSPHGAFFLLVRIFEFCQFEFQWISRKSKSLEGLLHSRLLTIKEKPLCRNIFDESYGEDHVDFAGIGKALQKAHSDEFDKRYRPVPKFSGS